MVVQPLLNSLSPDQSNVVHLARTHNVRVSACPGSGKTRTAAAISASLSSDERVLMLVYNANLRRDTRAFAETYGLENLEVHTFHSFLVKYFGASSGDDVSMELVLRSPASNMNVIPVPKFHTIIIDECQDMTPRYFAFVKHIVRYGLCSPPCEAVQAIHLFGDSDQFINGYRGADPGIFENAGHETFDFAGTRREWVGCRLGSSYRMHAAHVSFLNAFCQCSPPLTSMRPGGTLPKHALVRCADDVLGLVRNLRKRYADGDILILAPSLRASKILTHIVNHLVRDGVKMAVTISGDDDDSTDPNAASNEPKESSEIMISTFHASKGIERDVVVVLGLDSSYARMFMRGGDTRADETQHVRPTNDIYVALSRAKTEMIIVNDIRERPLPFLTYTPECIDLGQDEDPVAALAASTWWTRRRKCPTDRQQQQSSLLPVANNSSEETAEPVNKTTSLSSFTKYMDAAQILDVMSAVDIETIDSERSNAIFVNEEGDEVCPLVIAVDGSVLDTALLAFLNAHAFGSWGDAFTRLPVHRMIAHRQNADMYPDIASAAVDVLEREEVFDKCKPEARDAVLLALLYHANVYRNGMMDKVVTQSPLARWMPSKILNDTWADVAAVHKICGYPSRVLQHVARGHLESALPIVATIDGKSVVADVHVAASSYRPQHIARAAIHLWMCPELSQAIISYPSIGRHYVIKRRTDDAVNKDLLDEVMQNMIQNGNEKK